MCVLWECWHCLSTEVKETYKGNNIHIYIDIYDQFLVCDRYIQRYI